MIKLDSKTKKSVNESVKSKSKTGTNVNTTTVFNPTSSVRSELMKPQFVSQIVFTDLTDIYKPVLAETDHPYQSNRGSEKPRAFKQGTAGPSEAADLDAVLLNKKASHFKHATPEKITRLPTKEAS